MPLVIVSYVELVDAAHLREQVSALRGELVRSQQTLSHAQRLEATGRLSDIVAHDLNNVLTSIFCFTRLAVDDLATDDPRRGDLLEVLKSAENAARLTQQLLAFSRRRPSQPVQLEINAVLTRLQSLLRRTFGERGELVIEPAAEALQVLCDPDQLDQLLFNLVMHAKETATMGAGVLAVQPIELRQSATGATVASGDYVALSVRRAELTHMVTLDPERCSVLTADHPSLQQAVALSACRQIVEQAHGMILLGPHSDGGVVYALLPRRDPRPAGEVWGRPSRMPNALRGTVLVVDDDAPLMRTMARTLVSLGLRVIEAGSAEDALGLLEVDGRVIRPDLVVTNTSLPGMSGLALVARLRAAHSRLHALYVSVRPEDDATQREAGAAFMLKPFTGRQLALQVAALLGEPVTQTVSRPS
jgi:DNA-binding response OmpR family regulator